LALRIHHFFDVGAFLGVYLSAVENKLFKIDVLRVCVVTIIAPIQTFPNVYQYFRNMHYFDAQGFRFALAHTAAKPIVVPIIQITS